MARIRRIILSMGLHSFLGTVGGTDMLFPHTLIQWASLQQLFLCASPHDPAFAHHDDLSGAADGGQPVGNNDKGFPFYQLADGLLYERFAFGVGIGSPLRPVLQPTPSSAWRGQL